MLPFSANDSHRRASAARTGGWGVVAKPCGECAPDLLGDCVDGTDSASRTDSLFAVAIWCSTSFFGSAYSSRSDFGQAKRRLRVACCVSWSPAHGRIASRPRTANDDVVRREYTS